MKKRINLLCLFLLACLLLCTCAHANGWGLSGKLYQAVSATHDWDDYTALCSQAGPFAVMHTRYHNALFFADEYSHLHVYTTAVYQPDNTGPDPVLTWDGPYLVIRYRDTESYTFRDLRQDGEYHLIEAVIDDFQVAGITGGSESIWYYEVTDQEDSLQWATDVTLSTFNISLFPHSTSEIRSWNLMQAQLGCHVQCPGPDGNTGDKVGVDYPGALIQPKKQGTAAVYSSPYGSSAWRAGKGRAAVGLNGDLWLLSTYRNEEGQSYACIRYDVSQRTQRIGYALCRDLGLPEITDWHPDDPLTGFAHVDVEATADTWLTDDPDVSQYRHFHVPKGTLFSCMGLYNDYYAYVAAEVRDAGFTDGGAIVWGFVPIRDLAPMNQEKQDALMEQLEGSWRLAAGGSLADDYLALDRSGTFVAFEWDWENDITCGMERTGSWLVTGYSPMMNLYRNRPPCQLILHYDDGSVVICGLTLNGDGFSLTDGEGGGSYSRIEDASVMTLSAFREKWQPDTDDLYAWYQALCLRQGPFVSWTPEEQYRFNQMMMDISESNLLRKILAHPGWIDNNSVAYEITQWRYGLPQDVPVSQSDACQKARELLSARYGYGNESDGWHACASLYTGHWVCDEFDSPWWVIHWYDEATPVTEVWINAETGDAPLHDTTRVIEQGKDAYLTADPDLLYIPAEESYYTDDRITVIYLDREAKWKLFVDSGTNSLWEITIDDLTLESEGVDASNG